MSISATPVALKVESLINDLSLATLTLEVVLDLPALPPEIDMAVRATLRRLEQAATTLGAS